MALPEDRLREAEERMDGEDSANHSLFGELLIALSGLLGFFGIEKRKKDKEE